MDYERATFGELFGGEETLDGLRERYLELTRETLPAAGCRRGWPIVEDHCFMRVLLDRLFDDCWYKHLDRRRGAAYRQLTGEQLRRVIAMAEELLADEGDSLIHDWNRQSLWVRGKLR